MKIHAFGAASPEMARELRFKTHKLSKMNGELDRLRGQMKDVADVNADHLIDRLNLAPFKV